MIAAIMKVTVHERNPVVSQYLHAAVYLQAMQGHIILGKLEYQLYRPCGDLC